jgi:hypothetical protein
MRKTIGSLLALRLEEGMDGLAGQLSPNNESALLTIVSYFLSHHPLLEVTVISVVRVTESYLFQVVTYILAPGMIRPSSQAGAFKFLRNNGKASDDLGFLWTDANMCVLEE